MNTTLEITVTQQPFLPLSTQDKDNASTTSVLVRYLGGFWIWLLLLQGRSTLGHAKAANNADLLPPHSLP
jgi:hypothetical protein